MTEPWTPDLSQSTMARYKAIAEAIGNDIQNDILKPGMRLPAQRQLAYRLNVTLGTVTRGYDEAKRLGLIGGETGRGTYILGGNGTTARHDSYMPVATDKPVDIDLALNRNASSWNQGIINRTLKEISESGDLTKFMDYQTTQPFTDHTLAGTQFIEKTGLKAPHQQIVVTNGAQHGTMIALMALTRPGDPIAVEELSYPMIKHLAQHLGLKLWPVKMDDQGLLPDALEHVCQTKGPKALYCMPTLHNPTTAIMDDQRRKDIGHVCRRHGLHIIEDDILGLLPKNAPPPLSAYIPELSCYVTSVSKVMAAGLRIGYVLAPIHKLQALRAGVRVTGWMASPIMAEIAKRWITGPIGDTLIQHHQRQAAERHDILMRILGDHTLHAHAASYHVWLKLPSPWREQEFKTEAARQGVAIISGDNFAIGATPTPQAVRICLGRPAHTKKLQQGLEILAHILDQAPGADPALI